MSEKSNFYAKICVLSSSIYYKFDNLIGVYVDEYEDETVGRSRGG